jgi:cell division protein WhiA
VSFTDAVREELAHLPLGPAAAVRLEAAGLLRVGAVLTLAGGESAAGGFGAVFRTGSGGVARRLHALLRELDAAPQIEVHRPGGLERGTVYRLRLEGGHAAVLRRCALLDAQGRPAGVADPSPCGPRTQILAYVRGAVMGAGNFSELRAAPHAEVAVASPDTAQHLQRLLDGLGVIGARAGGHGDGWRVVLKSGEGIGTLLAALGAHTAYLAWDDARLRRQLRSAANRVANADRANVARSVGAAARQVDAITRLVARHGWEGLPEHLGGVALARVANPEASLSELGELLDPPLAKGAVHRRLTALVALAGGDDAAEDA